MKPCEWMDLPQGEGTEEARTKSGRTSTFGGAVVEEEPSVSSLEMMIIKSN